jgi:hypothetical protein
MFKGFRIGDRIVNLHQVRAADTQPGANVITKIFTRDSGDIDIPNQTLGAALYTALMAL